MVISIPSGLRMLINHMNGLIRFDLTRVPQVTLVGSERCFASGHEDLVCGLSLPSYRRLRREFPAQPRFPHVDTQRVDQVFATQIVWMALRFLQASGISSRAND